VLSVDCFGLRGGLVFKAHRLVYHSTLGWRVIKKKKLRVYMDAFISFMLLSDSDDSLMYAEYACVWGSGF